MSLIQHQSAPTSNIFDFTGIDFSAFIKANLYLNGVVVDTDAAEIYLQLYIAGVLQTASYEDQIQQISASGSTSSRGQASASAITLAYQSTVNWGVGNAAGESFVGRVSLMNLNLTPRKLVTFQSAMVGPTGNSINASGGGCLTNSGTVTGLRISGNGGLITSGSATLEGIPTV